MVWELFFKLVEALICEVIAKLSGFSSKDYVYLGSLTETKSF